MTTKFLVIWFFCLAGILGLGVYRRISSGYGRIAFDLLRHARVPPDTIDNYPPEFLHLVLTGYQPLSTIDPRDYQVIDRPVCVDGDFGGTPTHPLKVTVTKMGMLIVTGHRMIHDVKFTVEPGWMGRTVMYFGVESERLCRPRLTGDPIGPTGPEGPVMVGVPYYD